MKENKKKLVDKTKERKNIYPKKLDLNERKLDLKERKKIWRKKERKKT